MHKTKQKQKLSINRPDNLLTMMCMLVFSVFVCSGHGLVSMAEKCDRHRRRLERWTAQNLGHWVRDVCDRCWHQLTGEKFHSGDVMVLLIVTHDSKFVHLSGVFFKMGWEKEKPHNRSRPSPTPHRLLDLGLHLASPDPPAHRWNIVNSPHRGLAKQLVKIQPYNFEKFIVFVVFGEWKH